MPVRSRSARALLAARSCAAIAALAVAAPAALAQPLNGTVEQHSFVGPITSKTVLYNIYLPAGYSTSTARYPVIYHLHGIGGNQGGPQNTQVPAAFETALAACRIGPVIVVFPNGYTDNFWADSIDGAEPAETNVALELVPHVDSFYRTIPDRSNRVIEGFSMGGFGTMKFYAKFTDLFCCAVEYDGALVTWADVVAFHPTVASQVFGNSQAYFDIYSPWTWASTNAPTLSQNLNIRMLAGALVSGNRRFHDYLTGLSIPTDYAETGCDHNLPCLLSAQGQNSATFIAARLRPFVASTTACRAGGSLTALGAGKAPFTYKWQIADAGAPGGWRDLANGTLTVGGNPVATITGAAAQTINVSTASHPPTWPGSQFRCLVTNACGTATSNSADLSICAPDLNCDGFVDGIDYDTFNNDFEAGDPSADFNADGFVDGIDYDQFNNAFEAGC